MLSKITAALRGFVARIEREGGQALAEYGLILALIAIAAIIALGVLGVVIAGNLDAIALYSLNLSQLLLIAMTKVPTEPRRWAPLRLPPTQFGLPPG